MSGRNRSEKTSHESELTKREERILTNGEGGSKRLNPSSRQATVEAGGEVVKYTHKAPEVDDISATASLGISESAQRDAGVSIPDSPYQNIG